MSKTEPRLSLAALVIAMATTLPTAFAGLPGPDRPFALLVGDPAPPVRVSAYHKGVPITEFRKGTVYVIDFWSTWCGPCQESYPRLTALQKKYGDRVRVLGVSVWEPREKDVAPFVAKWDESMGYTVASDRVEGVTTTDEEKRSREAVQKGLMSRSYLVDSGWSENGIPCAFVIDREGRIAWIGNPTAKPAEFDEAVDEVVSGRHDLAAAAAAYRRKMEVEVFARGERQKVREARKAGDLAKAAEHFDALIALGRDYEDAIAGKYALLLIDKRSPAEADALLGRTMADLEWWTIMDMAASLAYEGRDLEAGQLKRGIEACRLALSKLGREHTWPLMTMAAMHFRLGENAAAAASVDRALLIAKENDRKGFRATRDQYLKGGGSLKEPPAAIR